VLRHRAPELVRLFESLEAFATSLGPIELVARDRYVLLRSVRIFADVVMMTDAVRVAVHLRRPVDDSLFFKVVTDGKKVTGVTKLQTQGQLQRLLPYIEEAYEASLH
jgi:predicted transport protein